MTGGGTWPVPSVLSAIFVCESASIQNIFGFLNVNRLSLSFVFLTFQCHYMNFCVEVHVENYLVILKVNLGKLFERFLRLVRM